MRVGIVLDESLDGTDGVQQYVLRLTEWLRAQGHEIHYLVGETTRTDLPNVHSLTRNVHVRFNGNRLSTPLPPSSKRLQALLAELQLDVLHVQVPYSPFMAGRLIRYALPKTVVIGTFHILPYSKLATAANWVLGLVLRPQVARFDRMVAVSQPAAEFARRYYGYVCTVIPNCFDYGRFTLAAPQVKTKHIVFLGRLVDRKGPQELLRAVNHLVQSGTWPQDWHVLLGGKGGLDQQLAAYIAAQQLGSYVTLKGFIAEADKAAFLAQSDIAVFPSTAGESFGISLLEAMAASKGVVLAGDNPGYRSVMKGFEQQLFDPRDTPAFASLLAQWMIQGKMRARTAKRQKDHVAQFDAPVIGQTIVELYQSALQKRL